MYIKTNIDKLVTYDWASHIDDSGSNKFTFKAPVLRLDGYKFLVWTVEKYEEKSPSGGSGGRGSSKLIDKFDSGGDYNVTIDDDGDYVYYLTPIYEYTGSIQYDENDLLNDDYEGGNGRGGRF